MANELKEKGAQHLVVTPNDTALVIDASTGERITSGRRQTSPPSANGGGLRIHADRHFIKPDMVQ